MSILKTLLLIILALVVIKFAMDAVGFVGLGVLNNTYIKGKNVGKNLRQ